MPEQTTDSKGIAKAQAAYAKQIESAKPQCGTGSILLQHEESGSVRYAPILCHKWSCDYCSTRRRLETLEKIKAGHPERHIVLTLKPKENITIKDQIQFLRDAFTKLKTKIRRTFEKFEYLAVIELTKKGTPHMHILQRGTYIPYRWLKDAWSTFTGAWQVSITAVENTSNAANELAKYLTKTARQLEKIAPRMSIITTSKGWRIDAPEESSEYSLDGWKATFVPYPFHEVEAAMETMLDAELEDDPDGPGYKIRGPDPPELEMWLKLTRELHGHAKKLAWKAYDILCTAKNYNPWKARRKKQARWEAEKYREQQEKIAAEEAAIPKQTQLVA